MTERPIHSHEGLTAILLDNEAIAIYTENSHCVTMTLDEWRNINMALGGVKETPCE